MTSMLGRGIRIVVGAALVPVGLLVGHGTAGIMLAAVGLVPLLAGIFNVCVFAPLFGSLFSGRSVQK